MPPSSAPATHPAPQIQPASAWPTRRQLFLAFGAYFLLQLITRSLISEVAGIDEADQIVVGQKLGWGYGPQPPLFTWLLTAFMHVFGYSIFSLTLLRELLLFAIYWLTYLNAARLTRSHVAGVAAALALQLHPSICWESQRELTHSILASAMVLAMLWAFLRLEPARWAFYLAFGAFGALAVLSKYNTTLFYCGLLLAALTVPEARRRVLCRQMAAALGLSILILLPHLIWVATHQDLAFASVYKFHIPETAAWCSPVLAGLKAWVSTSAAHLAVLMVMTGLLFWRPIFVERAVRLPNAESRVLWRTFLIVFGIVVFSVLVFRVTSFKDRWLQPIFVCVPILLVAALADSLSATRLRNLAGLGVIAGVVVSIASPGRLLLTERLHKREILNAPFRQLAPELALYATQADFVVSNDRWMAANVHLWFADRLAISPDLMNVFHPSGHRCLLVWEATSQPDPPATLTEFARDFTGQTTIPQPLWLEKTLKYAHSNRIRIGLMTLERAGS